MHRSPRSPVFTKKPWVPPPGKASRKSGNFSESKSKVLTSAETSISLLQDQQILHPSETHKLPMTLDNVISTTDANPNPSVDYEAIAGSSTMDKTSTQEKKIEELYISLQKLQQDLSRFGPICISLKEISQILHKPISVPATEELTMKQMVIQTDQHLRDFRQLFGQFENSVSASECAIISNKTEFARCLETSSDYKEKTFNKCLEVYDSVTSSLKFFIEIIQQEHLSSLFSSQEMLTSRLETLQEDFLTREAKIQELSNNLSLSQKEAHSLASEKHSLERKVTTLNSELYEKESMLRKLTHETYASDYVQKMIRENNDLIKVAEDFRREIESEKNALKKALKVQKLRAEQCTTTIQQLRSQLNEKEHDMFLLAADRDQWKKQITNINNKLTEAKSEKECLKSKNLKLQEQIENLEKTQIKSKSELSSIVEEKSKLLTAVTEEKEKLNVTLKSTQQSVSSLEKETEILKQKCKELEDKLREKEDKLREKEDKLREKEDKLREKEDKLREKEDKLKETEDQLKKKEAIRSSSVERDSDKDMHLFALLLEELKTSLSVIKENGFQVSMKTKSTEVKSSSSSENDLVELVKEIKNLIETKEIQHCSLEDNLRNIHIASSGSKEQELLRYDNQIAQKQKLLEQIEEKLNSTNVKSSIPDHHILEPNPSVLGMETTSHLKIASLEEELRNRNQELASIQQQKFDVEQRCNTQIHELKGDLDRITTNYESLQKYVNMLKSSYVNVFGSS